MKNIDWNHARERLKRIGIIEPGTSRYISQMKAIDAEKQKKNAVILAHYYQILPIQILADFTGDSLALAQTAAKMEGDGLVVSSTVHFMAEMVKLLSPQKKVVIPDLEASCSIAEGINGTTIAKIRGAYPEAGIVGYINTTAEAKAEMDAVCTSANAEQIISRIEGNPVIMLPDHYFAQNIISKLQPSEKEFLIYKGIVSGSIVLQNARTKTEQRLAILDYEKPKLDKGTCVVHEAFTPQQVRYMKQKGVLVLAHPEVSPEVAKEADMVGGTSKMIEYVRTTNTKTIMYLTECDLAAPLTEAYPDREFITPCILCPYMKKNTLDNLLYSLKNEVHEITLDPKSAFGAKKSLDKMLELMQPVTQ